MTKWGAWGAGVLAAAALSWAGGVRAAETAKEHATGMTKAESQQKVQEKKHPLFEGKSNYDVDGKIGQVSHNRISIERKNLPAATLHISPNTKIELDGKAVSSTDLKRGQDVKASFNLSGERPEAVDIKATPLKSEGPSGPAGQPQK